MKALRDVSIEMFNDKIEQLDPVVAKRARHVITENERTLQAADALSAGDLKRMGELMEQSHASMRDDFEITVKEIDALVDIVKDVIGDQGGVRMTGGGFGGCIVALVPPSLVNDVEKRLKPLSTTKWSYCNLLHVCQAKAGAGLIQ